MTYIDTAERAGTGLNGTPRPSEDRILVTDNAIVLLDGATSRRAELRSAGWYADVLGEALREELAAAPTGDLADIATKAIAVVVRTHDLRPLHSPSSTIAIARWSADRIDGYVLADSPVIAFGDGKFSVLADHRLDTLVKRGMVPTDRDPDSLRNVEGGFWSAEATPSAARQGFQCSWNRNNTSAVMITSNGVSIGVDEYKLFDWAEALTIARTHGVGAVMDAVHRAEAHDDPSCTRWPRSKCHDDKAIVLIDFDRD